ncbi:ATP phosphoribosyltransferase regulatory subunit [Polyangium sorediatum]|uniref:ATP phosphoribosyltransferase regulatory subunit n=1 Tax=Polyangium sorediatum TaxID=889274 RepID=A0ABT6NXI8_9BACT|nr:ATP phosphoribosyltransferase regulatory subunit [Polyangium sorediatum]MDI1433029.1 ATP phosphoribosyltransferase regulatory subunit [Polyangium sorediatum]
MDRSGTPPKALSHPLPAGMRDLLPDETRRRRALARTLLDHFALHGYDLVTPPAFELAEVLEKGLGALDPGDVLRFVEPESGEVCALRPDMTPQIARMVATRLAAEPAPIRLCYEGTIVRRRQGRAKKHRQIPQAGVELYGAPSPEGDLEALRLLASVTQAVGLGSFVIDLGHALIARALVDVVPSPLDVEVTDALAQKDASRLLTLLSGREAAGVPKRVAEALVALPELAGGAEDRPGEEILSRAEKLFVGTGAEGPLRELRALWETARGPSTSAAGLGDVLRLDLGEVRGFAYYTGPIFHVLAPGPGEPVGAGGRYDDLLERFGLPMQAVGFGLHLDAIARAREAAGVREERPLRVLVSADPPGEALASSLRARGIATAWRAPGADVLRYAAAHRFSHVVTAGSERALRISRTDKPEAAVEIAAGTGVDVDVDGIVRALGE